MICPHCGAQWQLPSNSKIIKKECPFCNGDMCVCDENLTTLETVLQEIINRFGTNVLSDGAELLSIFSCMAPTLTKEKAVLQFLIEDRIHEKIFEISISDTIEQKLAYQNLVQNIMEKTEKFLNIFLPSLDQYIVTNIPNQANLTYDYNELGDNSIELTLLKGDFPEVIDFPEIIDGKKVIGISGDIFGSLKTKNQNRENIKFLNIPNSITRIGDGAFSGCKSLSNVILPKALVSLGSSTFKNCKNLNNIVLSDTVSFIGKEAFAGTGIKRIVLPKNIDVINGGLFKNCKKLSNVELPDKLKFIEDEAFSGCKDLITIEIPNKTEAIGKKSFNDCKSLVKVSLPDGLKSIGREAFQGCESLKEINLPNTIIDIANGAFARCRALADVQLPNSITTIAYETFYGCHSLKRIVIPESVSHISGYSFEYCDYIHVFIPNSVNDIHDDMFFNSDDVVIHCNKDSYAHKYAQKNKIKVELMKEN